MAGLDPAIHVFMRGTKQDVDARHKAGHDEKGIMLRRPPYRAPPRRLSALCKAAKAADSRSGLTGRRSNFSTQGSHAALAQVRARRQPGRGQRRHSYFAFIALRRLSRCRRFAFCMSSPSMSVSASVLAACRIKISGQKFLASGNAPPEHGPPKFLPRFPPKNARGAERRKALLLSPRRAGKFTPLAQPAGLGVRPKRRAFAFRRSTAAILRPGAVLPGPDRGHPPALIPQAFARVRPVRVQPSKAGFP